MPKCLLAQRKRDWISRQPYQTHLVLGVTILQSYLHRSSEKDFIGNYFVIYHKVRLKRGYVFWCSDYGRQLSLFFVWLQLVSSERVIAY